MTSLALLVQSVHSSGRSLRIECIKEGVYKGESVQRGECIKGRVYKGEIA